MKQEHTSERLGGPMTASRLVIKNGREEGFIKVIIFNIEIILLLGKNEEQNKQDQEVLNDWKTT